MSAKAEESTLPMKEMLKPTGYIAPDSVADKTFAEMSEDTPDNPVAGISWDDSENAWFFFVNYATTFKSNMSKLVKASQASDMYLWDKTTKTKLDGGDIADDLYVADNKIVAGHELVITIFTNSTYNYQQAVA